MTTYFELRKHTDNQVLFSGHFDTIKHCIETAIDRGIKLDELGLMDADLSHSNLDGAVMNYARFERCDFTGANLSEAHLIKSTFKDCILRDACLCDTTAVGVDFQGSQMENVDVHYADLRGILVTCADFLRVDFSNTAHMARSTFMAHGVMCPMTRRPVFVRGLGLDMVVLDEHAILGGVIVLRRDQIKTTDSLSNAFAQSGLQPAPENLGLLWDTVQRIAA